MTQEDEKLLLSDLCARLPYGVHCYINNIYKTYKLFRIEVDQVDGILVDLMDNDKSTRQVYLSELKPNLFSFSDITMDQKMELIKTNGLKVISNEYYYTPEATDFFLRNHIDYRGLIEKGLAYNAKLTKAYDTKV